MAAAEQLQRQAAAETDPARKGELEKSLGTLVTLLEQMDPDIDREAKDATEAHEFLNMLQDAYAKAGAKLKAARSDLDRAQRDMARAAQQRDVAGQRAEAARQAAGLSSATSSLNVALKAMQDSAARDLAAAEAANAKAKLLTPTSPERDDPNIVTAMAAASGARTGASIGERLTTLRERQRLAPPDDATPSLPPR
jgi:hypothetical protein